MEGIDDRPSRTALLEELRTRLGPGKEDLLLGLPEPELRYLHACPGLVHRYNESRRGRFLFEWEMSAPERGASTAAEIDRFAPIAWTGCRALDAGCGDGGLLVALARRGALAHGIDLEPSNVAGARLRASAWRVAVHVVYGSIVELPFRSNSMSLVTCSDVIEHVKARREAIGEMARVLKPGGVLYLSAPTRFRLRNLWTDPHFGCLGIAALPAGAGAWYLTHVRRRLASPEAYGVETLPSFGSLCHLLRRAGFAIVAGEMPHRRDPDTIAAPWKRSVLKLGRKAGLAPVLALLSALWAEFLQPMRVICRRIG